MQLLLRIFKSCYGWVFGAVPSDFTTELVRNFIHASIGMGAATVLTFGINIFAARTMGPAEFGKWNLIGSWAEFIVILPLFGFTTAVPRYLGAGSPEAKEKIIGTSFRITAIISIFSFPFLWLVQQRFHIIQDPTIGKFAFGYAVILAFFYLFQAYFQGLKQFKKLSLFWFLSALGFVGIVLIYIFGLHNLSFLSLYWGNVFRLAFIVGMGLVFFAPKLWSYDRREAKQLMHFGSFSMLSIFAGFFSLGSIDNIMINRYLGPASVGIYAAYYVAFSVFVSRLLNVFMQVFLPMAAGHSNLKNLLRHVMKSIIKLFLPSLLGLVVMIRLLFYFYGRHFIFNWTIAVVLAFNITLYSCVMLVGNIMSAKGVGGARLGFISAVIAAGINVVLDIALIPRMGLLGSVVGSLSSTSSVVIFQYFVMTGRFLDEA